MSKKMRLWMAGTVGVLMAGFMSVSVYALEEKDVIGTWYVNELSMGEGASFHPGAMGMEVTVDIKEDGKMETTSSVYGEEPEVDESEWKIENDKILMTHNDQTEECEYKDGKITLTADGTTMILSQEKEEYEPYVPGKPVENPTMKDFEGEWSCTLMEAFGMQMPVNADFTGFEMSMSVEDGKAEIILIESGEETKVELQGDVEGNALVLKAVTEDEAGTMTDPKLPPSLAIPPAEVRIFRCFAGSGQNRLPACSHVPIPQVKNQTNWRTNEKFNYHSCLQ